MSSRGGDRKVSNPQIYVGGLPSDISMRELRNTFEKYGKILEV